MGTPPISRPAGRLALSINEAAEALGVSEAHFKRHVLPVVHVTMSGRRRLISIHELERYLSHHSGPADEGRVSSSA